MIERHGTPQRRTRTPSLRHQTRFPQQLVPLQHKLLVPALPVQPEIHRDAAASIGVAPVVTVPATVALDEIPSVTALEALLSKVTVDAAQAGPMGAAHAEAPFTVRAGAPASAEGAAGWLGATRP